jgi:Trp operon repressor
MSTLLPIEQELAEVDARRRLVDLLGSPEEREAARKRLGISRRQLAEMCGLDYRGIANRESVAWKMTRGSLTSAAGQRYVKIVIRMMRGL